MSSTEELSRIAVEDGVGVLMIDSPPVNALGIGVRRALEAGINQLRADNSVVAIVLLCGGRTFFAGADISEFGKPPQNPLLPEVLKGIENCPKPVIAAMHGTALGGGYELALNCHYRIAVPSAKVGLPEVKLGLLPGAGGTQRLPRLVGPALALELIVNGDAVPAPRALELGMIDALAREAHLRADAIAYARGIVANRSPLRRVRDRDAKIAPGSFRQDLFETFRAANAASMRGFKAPEHVVRAVEASVSLPFDEAIARERELFHALRASPESAAQRYYFFAERETSKIPAMPAVAAVRTIAAVGIVGAGKRGGGIAMAAANAGLPVTLVDRSDAALDRARETIGEYYDAQVREGRVARDEATWRHDLISLAGGMASLSAADLIVEAVSEQSEITNGIVRELGGIAGPDAILAVSTSLVDLEGIASASNRPDRVIGLRFFAPAVAARLVEVVRGALSAPAAVAGGMSFARKLGKVAVLSGACPGLIADRVMSALATQARAAISEGARPAEIDALLGDYGFRAGHGPIMGLCSLGLSGQAKSVRAPADRVRETVRPRTAENGEDLLERLLFPVVNEGAKLLGEGVASRASDIDVAAILGYGWPVYKGGPMFWADQIGLPRILAALQGLQARHGDVFRPSALLEEKVARGTRFTRE